MTYVCGYQDNGVNFIVCDTRITWRDNPRKEPLDVAVKSGHLFPGCIFARTGDMTTSAKFITAAKNRIDPQLTPTECWERFVDFVDEYPFSKGEFTLLLSTRAFGQPEFYCLNSKEKLRVCQPDPIVGLGSGKSLLNSAVKDTLKKLAQIRQQWSDDIHSLSPNDEAGYFICHELSLYALSYRRNVMAEHHVGGIFHFIAQTDSQEYRQRPSLYLVTVFSPQTSTIDLWMYRVASVLDGILVETYYPPGQINNDTRGAFGRETFFDVSTSIQVSENIIHNRVVGREFGQYLQQELASLEWSYYCGWGFADPNYWGNYGWQFNPKGSKLPITVEGELDPTLANDILNQIRSVVDVGDTIILRFANKIGRLYRLTL